MLALLGRIPRLFRALLALWLISITTPALAFHFPWDQEHDSTLPLQPPPAGPEDRPECDPDCNGSNSRRSPVMAASGQAFWRDTDVVLRGRPFMGVVRTYNSNDPVVGLFGNGWSVDFDIALYPANSGGQIQRILRAANGKRFIFVRQPDGSYKPPASRFETIVEGASSVTMTSPDGRRQVFALDGRMLERYDINENRIAFSYDSSARPVRLEDGNGRSLTITYNGMGFVDSVTDHGSRTWRYSYDASGNLLTVQDPAAGRRSYRYQAYKPPGDAQTYQQLLSVTDPSGVSAVQFTYLGNQVATYTEGANRFSYTRNSGNTKLGGTVTRTDAAGVRSTFVYGGQGLVTRDIDALNGITDYFYDANGRLTQTTDALGRKWISTYDSQGRMTSSQNPLNQKYTLTYNGSDPRPRTMVSPMGRTTRLTYDTRGNLLTTTDPSGAVTRFSYSTRGDPNRIENALGQRVTMNYTGTGLTTRVTDALNRQTNLTYDSLGRVGSVTNPAGELRQYTYDALDRTLSVIDPLGQTTSFTYDAAGRMLTVTDPKGSRTEYQYDAFGRRAMEIAPDGRRTVYTYRADNLLDRATWPDNSAISYLYDANKRITRQTAGSEVINFTLYNAVNQLRTVSGPGGTVSYDYDDAGRVTSETSNGKTNITTRNADGERIQLDALGQTQVYIRDARGLVTRIAASAGNFDFAYDDLGRRTSLTYPNGSTAGYSFDAAGQLKTLTHAGVFSAGYAYTYDLAGRTTTLTGDGPNWSYSYDPLGRLTQATQGASSTTYTLDQVGNILDGGRTLDANHRLTGDAAKTYGYDQRGNLTSEQDRTTGARTVYTWNVKNQLRQVQFFPNATTTTASRTLAYTYDPVGRRASKTDNSVQQQFVYDGNDLIGTLDASGNTVATNVFSGAIDEPLATTTAGTAKTLYADHLGSIKAVADGSTLTHAYGYGPYGETLLGSGADSGSFRYTGREKDTDSLYYYRARYYSTSMQRFVSDDPIGLAAGVNGYSYVVGDPINSTDPFGLEPPDYQPNIWNDGGAIQKSNNCYSYAADRPYGNPSNNKPQPGDLSRGWINPWRYVGRLTCDSITGAAKRDGFTDGGGQCPANYHSVALVIAPGIDYHWYRRDQNGGWSHKPGHTSATNVDASGNIITDPSTADRNYSPGPNYSVVCPQLCAPDR